MRASPGRRGGTPVLLAVPGLTAAAVVLLPLAYLVVRTASGGSRAWEVLRRARTLELIWSTGLLVAGVTVAAVLVAVPLAWLVTRTDLPGRRAWAVAAALPLVIPSYVAALCLLGAFGSGGLLRETLGLEHVPDITGYWGALFALTLSTYPYVFLLTAAALRELDPSLEEAAQGLGLSRTAVFRRVALPALRPSAAAGALLVALYTLSDFGVVSLMRYDALTRAIYLQYRSLFDRTPAAVLGLVLVSLTAVVLVAEMRTRRGARYYRASPGAARRPVPVRLGRWRWPALTFCTLVVGAFLAVPGVVLGYWLEHGVAGDSPLEIPSQQALNSLGASGLAAVVAVAAALPVAVLALRYRSRWTVTLERACYVGNALPGIVIALSLVFFAARYVPQVYQTLLLLVLAYVVRFYAQALSGVGSALETVNPRLEEAARGLGRGRLQTLVTVTVPLARSGFLAGGALVFLSTMKELPATLLLRPIGFDTLATEIWKLTQVGAYSRAALPALALIIVLVPILFLLGRLGETAEPASGE